MNPPITEQTYPVEKIWVLKSIMGSLIFCSLYILLYVVSGSNTSEDTANVVVVITYLIGYTCYRYLSRQNFHYSIDDQFFTLRQGIFSKQQRNLPYGVIQNVLVKQDFFDRFFGTSSLIIENAAQGGNNAGGTRIFGILVRTNKTDIENVGFSGSKVSIPGLSGKNAEILKGIVLQKMKDNPVHDNQSGL